MLSAKSFSQHQNLPLHDRYFRSPFYPLEMWLGNIENTLKPLRVSQAVNLLQKEWEKVESVRFRFGEEFLRKDHTLQSWVFYARIQTILSSDSTGPEGEGYSIKSSLLVHFVSSLRWTNTYYYQDWETERIAELHIEDMSKKLVIIICYNPGTKLHFSVLCIFCLYVF